MNTERSVGNGRENERDLLGSVACLVIWLAALLITAGALFGIWMAFEAIGRLGQLPLFLFGLLAGFVSGFFVSGLLRYTSSESVDDESTSPSASQKGEMNAGSTEEA